MQKFAKLVLLLIVAAASPAASVELDLSAEQVKDRVRHRLDGKHFTARIHMAVREVNWSEDREISVWRDDEGSESERLMARFEAPVDMRGFAILYLEGQDRPNDYFIYQPWARRVRRIPQSVAAQDVYGIDLEYMGFGVAQLQPVDVESMTVDTLDGRQVYRIVEKARYSLQRFDRRVMWVDPVSFIPLRTEHKRAGKTTLIARTVSVKDIDGIPTPVETLYERPLEGSVVRMTVEKIDYEAPIPEAFFSTLQLIKDH